MNGAQGGMAQSAMVRHGFDFGIAIIWRTKNENCNVAFAAKI